MKLYSVIILNKQSVYYEKRFIAQINYYTILILFSGNIIRFCDKY